MSIEAATFIGDFQPLNPPSTDPRGQGDDHLRLIKTVLQNSFPTLEKAIYFGGAVAKSANFSILATDMNNLFLLSTAGGGFTATLPSGLLAADAGWSCRFMKVTTDVNPVQVAPATGTLTSGATSGLATARRCIPGIEFKAVWTGTAWIITRCQVLPVGCWVSFNATALPPGFEWPNGQTLAAVATAYPEYNAAVGSGVTPDLRGRVDVCLDNLGGSAAGRLAGGVISGSTIGASGGTDVVTLDKTMIPTGITSSGSNAISVASPGTVSQGGFLDFASGSGGQFVRSPSLATLTSTGANAISVTSNNTGGLSHSNLQPSLMCSKILIVE